MSDLTPAQASARLVSWTSGSGPGSLRAAVTRAATEAGPVIAGTSIGQFMQNGSRSRRSASDRGPLRIVSGATARAMRSPDGRDGGINTVSATSTGRGLTVTLTKGVSLSVAKGGYNEGRRAKSGVSLSFLRPAAEASRSRIADRALAIVRGSFVAGVAGRAGAFA